MGIIDRITGRGRTPVQDTRSALERAQTTNDPGVVGGSLTKFVDTLLDAGIDGFFTDQPDLGVQAVDTWMQGKKAHPGRGVGKGGQRGLKVR